MSFSRKELIGERKSSFSGDFKVEGPNARQNMNRDPQCKPSQIPHGLDAAHQTRRIQSFTQTLPNPNISCPVPTPSPGLVQRPPVPSTEAHTPSTSVRTPSSPVSNSQSVPFASGRRPSLLPPVSVSANVPGSSLPRQPAETSKSLVNPPVQGMSEKCKERERLRALKEREELEESFIRQAKRNTEFETNEWRVGTVHKSTLAMSEKVQKDKEALKSKKEAHRQEEEESNRAEEQTRKEKGIAVRHQQDEARAWEASNIASAGTGVPLSASTRVKSHTNGPPEDEAEWQRRQEEFSREQQEKFRQDSLKQEQERMVNAATKSQTTQIHDAWKAYEAEWSSLNDRPVLYFRTFPWPIVGSPQKPEDLTKDAISAFMLAGPSAGDSALDKTRERIRVQLLRWHPDRFNPKWLSKVDPHDRDIVQGSVAVVTDVLQELKEIVAQKIAERAKE